MSNDFRFKDMFFEKFIEPKWVQFEGSVEYSINNHDQIVKEFCNEYNKVVVYEPGSALPSDFENSIAISLVDYMDWLRGTDISLLESRAEDGRFEMPMDSFFNY